MRGRVWAAALLLCFVAATGLRAQDPREAVLATVSAFFDGMATRDTLALKRLSTAQGYIHAVRTDTTVAPSATSHADFIAAMGAARESYLERMWDPTVLVEGPLAVVWTRFDFHRGAAFSHCGINAILLVLAPEGWKISGVAYTFQQRDCPPSPLGAVVGEPR
jgi:hypothetical protein